jgi:hypothetical protein
MTHWRTTLILAACNVLAFSAGWGVRAAQGWAEKPTLEIRSAHAAAVDENAWLKASPLQGGLAPNFTAVPMKLCPQDGGTFCPYESCAASYPQKTDYGKLWNSYVVPGKDGPVVICEWRTKF